MVLDKLLFVVHLFCLIMSFVLFGAAGGNINGVFPLDTAAILAPMLCFIGICFFWGLGKANRNSGFGFIVLILTQIAFSIYAFLMSNFVTDTVAQYPHLSVLICGALSAGVFYNRFGLTELFFEKWADDKLWKNLGFLISLAVGFVVGAFFAAIGLAKEYIIVISFEVTLSMTYLSSEDEKDFDEGSHVVVLKMLSMFSYFVIAVIYIIGGNIYLQSFKDVVNSKPISFNFVYAIFIILFIHLADILVEAFFKPGKKMAEKNEHLGHLYTYVIKPIIYALFGFAGYGISLLLPVEESVVLWVNIASLLLTLVLSGLTALVFKEDDAPITSGEFFVMIFDGIKLFFVTLFKNSSSSYEEIDFSSGNLEDNVKAAIRYLTRRNTLSDYGSGVSGTFDITQMLYQNHGDNYILHIFVYYSGVTGSSIDLNYARKNLIKAVTNILKKACSRYSVKIDINERI